MWDSAHPGKVQSSTSTLKVINIFVAGYPQPASPGCWNIFHQSTIKGSLDESQFDPLGGWEVSKRKWLYMARIQLQLQNCSFSILLPVSWPIVSCWGVLTKWSLNLSQSFHCFISVCVPCVWGVPSKRPLKTIKMQRGQSSLYAAFLHTWRGTKGKLDAEIFVKCNGTNISVKHWQKQLIISLFSKERSGY